ncbi:MAG TPA: COX15/CtaA family protein [Chitinophagaceae bacterium]|nr:COX15/CtaA family protein [Chitinophagaceae bacterium]
MDELNNYHRTRPVAIWLLAGVFMIMVQVLLGGITRLTGSGLSITDWDPIMGAIPPLNHQEWVTAFHHYQATPQYRLVNSDFTLSNFKYIFFWEWFHRLWARLLGVVFLIPFIIFLVQKRFSRTMVKPMIILFLLGGLQGLVGWLMVKSGLVGDNIRVNHFKLAAHFITAMILLCYTLWFALSLLVKPAQRTVAPKLHKLTLGIIVILTIQLIYGSFMAGLHAALAAHTWPDINGSAIPFGMFRLHPELINITNNAITVQFIHRGLAYLLVVLLFIWWIRARKTPRSILLRRLCWLPIAVVLLQVTLGVLTVLQSTVHIPVDLAVAHQFGGMLLLEVMLMMIYLARKNADSTSSEQAVTPEHRVLTGGGQR